MTTTDCVVGGFPLIGTDAYGGVWTLLGMTGWHDGPQTRRDRLNKVGQVGSWPNKGQPDDLPISVSGVARYSNPESAKLASRQFRAIRDGEMIVIDAGGVLSMSVEIDNKSVDWLTHQVFTWSILATAPDPVKYGARTYGTATLSEATPGAGLVYPLTYPLDYGIPDGVTPGAVEVSNEGTTSYWPFLRIDGPVTNPIIYMSETGAWVKYTGFIPTGGWVNFDMRSREVLLNGIVSHRHKVTFFGDWLAIPPGGGAIEWTASDASANAFLSVTAFEGAWN